MVDKLDIEVIDSKLDDSGSVGTDSDTALSVLERTGSGRQKRRSTVITVQMVSKKGQLAGQKINTVQVAAERKSKDVETEEPGRRSVGTGSGSILAPPRESDSRSSSSPASDASLPLKIQKISDSSGNLSSSEGRKSGAQHKKDQSTQSMPALDLDTTDSDVRTMGVARPRFTSTPDRTLPLHSPTSGTSSEGFPSPSSPTQGFLSGDNSPVRRPKLLPSYDTVLTRKLYSARTAQRRSRHGVVVTSASDENLRRARSPIATSASDSNINFTLHKRYRPHSTSFHGSYDVIEETESKSSSDFLFAHMHKKRTVSDSDFCTGDSQQSSESFPPRDSWTSHAQVEHEVITFSSEQRGSGFIRNLSVAQVTAP